MDKIIADYIVRAGGAEIERIAREIAFEQTVEVPETLITSDTILENIVGQVVNIQPADNTASRFRVSIAFNAELANGQISQLLNLLFGNISIKNNIKLVDVTLPPSFVRRFRGPNFGINGVRQLCGVFDRPLLSTAIKPRGASHEAFARIAHDFALGGGDIVKDDHNLVDSDFEAFKSRVSRCQAAVQEANRTTGRNTLYFPYVLSPQDRLESYLDFVLSVGIRGVLLSPFLIGLDTVRTLAEAYPLVIMAHPTFTGTFFHDPDHGVAPGVLLGKLFRLIGCDISVFPNYGGRFSFTKEDCRTIQQHLQEPLGHLSPGLPAPAGGMRFENLAQMAEQYGPDAVFLIGGALLGDSDSLQASTEKFLDAITSLFPGHRHQNGNDSWQSACELPTFGTAEVLTHLPFQKDYSWAGRPASDYKSSQALPFQGVKRHELIGQHGERTRFDLRYFEIAPRGYSSLEKHIHTHAIICIRGKGELQINGEVIELKPFDIAYVPPLAVHQLRNHEQEPFGFFCIVDHDRDRPMKP